MSSYSGSPHDPVTADDLRHMPDDGWRYEFLRGRLLREPPAGFPGFRLALAELFDG